MITETPIYLRLLKYKEVKRTTEEFIDWENHHQNKLMKTHQSYILQIAPIPYLEYCEKFFNGTLENVKKKSYFKLFK